MDKATIYDMFNPVTFPNQRVSFKDKQKKEFYIPTLEYLYAVAMSYKNKELDEINLNAANGVLNKKVFDYVLKPYKNEPNSPLNKFEFPGEIRDTGLIKDILLKFIGEYIRLPHRFQTVVSSPDLIFRKNKNLEKIVVDYIQQAVINNLNTQGTNTGIESKQMPDLKVLVEKFEENYIDERAIKIQEILDYVRYKTQDTLFYTQAFFYWLAVGKFYTYRDVVNGTLSKELVPPMEAFPIPNNENFVEDYDGFVRVTNMTYNQILDKFGDKFEPSDLEYLDKIQRDYMNANGTISIPVSVFINRYGDEYWKTYGDPARDYIQFGNLGYVQVTHLTWHSAKLIKKLLYIDSLGILREDEVDEEYEFNEAHGDIGIKERWISATMEMFKIGSITDKISALYTRPDYIKVNRGELNDTYRNKLNYGGKDCLIPNVKFDFTIPGRLQSFQVYDQIYHLALERILYKEIVLGKIIPIGESLLEGGKMTSESRLFWLSADGRLFYDDTEPSKIQAANALRVVDPKVSDILTRIIDLIARNIEWAWDAIGWNRWREGTPMASDGKGVSEMALSQSLLSSIFITSSFDEARGKDYDADIDFMKLILYHSNLDEPFDSYVDQDGNPKTLLVDGKNLPEIAMGIFAINSAEEDSRLKSLQQIAFAAAQNGEMDIAVESALSKSSSQARVAIKEFSKTLREREETMQNMDNETKVKVQQMLEDTKQKDRESKERIAKNHDDTLFNIALLDDGSDGIAASNASKHLLDHIIREKELEVRVDEIESDERIANKKLQVEKQKTKVQTKK